MIGPILFILFLNFFAVSLAFSSLRTGKPAIVSMVLERSKGVSITKTKNPVWYWLITANYVCSAAGLAIQTPAMIQQILSQT